ncbi:FtsX-like permease family protein [Streptomyces nigra]|uniref:FtsX-like permease family protein n=1 Tax=Streptomyces nigra TaxID=1827580 RepID=UPI0036B4EF31
MGDDVVQLPCDPRAFAFDRESGGRLLLFLEVPHALLPGVDRVRAESHPEQHQERHEALGEVREVLLVEHRHEHRAEHDAGQCRDTARTVHGGAVRGGHARQEGVHGRVRRAGALAEHQGRPEHCPERRQRTTASGDQGQCGQRGEEQLPGVGRGDREDVRRPAGLGVFSTVVLDTRDRVHELGVHKSLGMTPRQVVGMVLTSVAGIGVVASAAGIPLGVAVHRRVTPLMGDAVGMDLPGAYLDVHTSPVLAVLLLGGVAVAVAGALVPAGRAARTDAAVALRTE